MPILSPADSLGNATSFIDRLNHRAELHKARVAAETRQSILDRIERESTRDDSPADDDGDIELY